MPTPMPTPPPPPADGDVLPSPGLPPPTVSYNGSGEVSAQPGATHQDVAMHVAALEGIVSLLLQQHDEVVKSFQESVSGHAKIMHRWNEYHRHQNCMVYQEHQPLSNWRVQHRAAQEIIGWPQAPVEPEASEAHMSLNAPGKAREYEQLIASVQSPRLAIEDELLVASVQKQWQSREHEILAKAVQSRSTSREHEILFKSVECQFPAISVERPCESGDELKGKANKTPEHDSVLSERCHLITNSDPPQSVSSQIEHKLPQTFLRQATANSYAASNYPASNYATQSENIWSKQLELEEMRDREAAAALCESSHATPSMAPEMQGWRSMLHHYVHSPIFEGVVTMAIITNAILIGIETQYMAVHRSTDLPTVFRVLGWVYTAIFFAELSVRITSEGSMFLKSTRWGWNLFDTVCVGCSLAEIFVDWYYEAAGRQNTKPQNANIVRIIRVMRTLRLSRTIRIGSLVGLVSALQILVSSIAATLKSLIWALVLMCMIVYICGIMFTQAATSHLIEMNRDEDYPDLIEYWADVGSSMSTLYESVTGGVSWREPATPLGEVAWVWEFLFTAYVSFTYFAVLNVVTGVFCNSAIEKSQHEPELVIKSLLSDQEFYEKNLKELFDSLDRDKSNSITIRELEKSLANPSVRAWFAAMGLEITDAWTLFKLIDEDRSHDVSSSEFVNRCMHLRGNARSIDLALLRREHSMMVKKMLQMADRIENNFITSREHLRSIGTSIGPSAIGSTSSEYDI